MYQEWMEKIPVIEDINIEEIRRTSNDR